MDTVDDHFQIEAFQAAKFRMKSGINLGSNSPNLVDFPEEKFRMKSGMILRDN